MPVPAHTSAATRGGTRNQRAIAMPSEKQKASVANESPSPAPAVANKAPGSVARPSSTTAPWSSGFCQGRMSAGSHAPTVAASTRPSARAAPGESGENATIDTSTAPTTVFQFPYRIATSPSPDGRWRHGASYARETHRSNTCLSCYPCIFSMN